MTYPAPVDKLLHLGDTRRDRTWRDYGALGLGPEHVPELIRMLEDEALHEADSESAEVWAPVHAWRALGQLREAAAVRPLLGLLYRVDDNQDDAVGEEVPEVLSMIGPAALAPTAAYLADNQHGTYARVAASTALGKIGQRFPAARDEAVAALMRTLALFGEYGRDEALNGFLISDLVDLKAVEAATLIERAFAAGVVDEMIMGDWPMVARELGLPAPTSSPPSSTEPDTATQPKRRRHRKKKGK